MPLSELQMVVYVTGSLLDFKELYPPWPCPVWCIWLQIHTGSDHVHALIKYDRSETLFEFLLLQITPKHTLKRQLWIKDLWVVLVDQNICGQLGQEAHKHEEESHNLLLSSIWCTK